MEKRVLRIRQNSEKELVWLLEHKSIFTAGPSAKNEDLINEPKHYQGKTLELTDVYQDFFEPTTVQDKYIMDIIKYAIRYRKKGLILDNLGKIKKLAEMCIEIENNKTKGLNDS